MNVFFALQLFDFFGVGAREGRGGVCFGGYLLSAAALLVYACQRVGRARTLNCFFGACTVKCFRTGGRCFRGISTIGDSTFS